MKNHKRIVKNDRKYLMFRESNCLVVALESFYGEPTNSEYFKTFGYVRFRSLSSIHVQNIERLIANNSITK